MGGATGAFVAWQPWAAPAIFAADDLIEQSLLKHRGIMNIRYDETIVAATMGYVGGKAGNFITKKLFGGIKSIRFNKSRFPSSVGT